ncbi:MAG: 2-C-methyl-D-erythritol 4-phosphate cytidylyltransferase [Rubricoccaceae bacterium]|nr:2-C-methyl-D-erythritol 4-phosphate cytidylyltransferase [Rubricoccaceae bacterium]
MEAFRRTEPPHAAVVIPAAGSGSRMGGEKKQFRYLGDAPVLVQTVRAFATTGVIKEIVVATAEVDLGRVRELLDSYSVDAAVIAGGATRQESVGNGIQALSKQIDVVLVHDAVRPFVSPREIQRLIGIVAEKGAAAFAIPVSETLRTREGGVFGETVDRRNVYRMLTPQGASRDRLVHAHKQASAEAFVGTDEVELLQRAGFNVELVPGDERNIKLTHPSDWALAEALWPEWVAEIED